jgi:site-specific DNA-methyltransferase (adenine-specific)
MIYKAQTPEAEQWLGWGTALKPAHEPIALARKPIKLSIAKNAQKWGTGALNIDATRVETTDKIQSHYNRNNGAPEFAGEEKNIVEVDLTISDKGRFPSNVIGEIPDYQKYFYCPKVSRKERHIGFDDVPDPLANYAQGDVKNHPLWDPSIGTNVQRLKHKIMENNKDLGKKQGAVKTNPEMVEDMGGYFVDENNNKTTPGGNKIWLPQSSYIYAHGLKEEYKKWCEANNKTPNVGNNHPTVKPIALMKYLIKLITPPGGIVLDPFNGSGSTGCAAVELGYEYIGCELDPAYVAITEKRIAAWNKQDTIFEELFE